MQKVEGSNPFSRFASNPPHVGGLVPAMAAETRSNHPRISPPFQALVPEMTPMRGDRDRAAVAADREWAAVDRAESARERQDLDSALRVAHLDDLTGAYRRGMGEIVL